jgi:hypothetical protein
VVVWAVLGPREEGVPSQASGRGGLHPWRVPWWLSGNSWLVILASSGLAVAICQEDVDVVQSLQARVFQDDRGWASYVPGEEFFCSRWVCCC